MKFFKENDINIDIIIFDESHRDLTSYTDTINDLQCKKLFLTATPTDDMIDNLFYGKLIEKIKIGELILKGYLKDIELHTPIIRDIDKESSIENIINECYKKEKNKIVIFLNTQIKAESLYDNLQLKESINCNYTINICISNRDDRFQQIETFETSEKSIIITVGIIGLGYDHPPIDTIIFADPKSSKIDIAQTTGRGLRQYKNKILSIFIPVNELEADKHETLLEFLLYIKRECEYDIFKSNKGITNISTNGNNSEINESIRVSNGYDIPIKIWKKYCTDCKEGILDIIKVKNIKNENDYLNLRREPDYNWLEIDIKKVLPYFNWRSIDPNKDLYPDSKEEYDKLYVSLKKKYSKELSDREPRKRYTIEERNKILSELSGKSLLEFRSDDYY